MIFKLYSWIFLFIFTGLLLPVTASAMSPVTASSVATAAIVTEAALAANNTHTNAYQNISPIDLQILIAHGRPKIALQALIPLVKSEPNNQVALYLIAEAYDTIGDTANAKKYMSKLLQLNPKPAFANRHDLNLLATKLGLKTGYQRDSIQARDTFIVTALMLLGIIALVVFAFFIITLYMNHKYSMALKQKLTELLGSISDIQSEIKTKKLLGSANGTDISKYSSAELTAIEYIKAINAQMNTLTYFASRRTHEDKYQTLESKVNYLKSTVFNDSVTLKSELKVNNNSEDASYNSKSTYSNAASACNTNTLFEYHNRPSQTTIINNNDNQSGLMSGLETGVGLVVGETLMDDLLDRNTSNTDNGFRNSNSNSNSNSNLNSNSGSNDGLNNSNSGSNDGFSGSNSNSGSNDGFSGSNSNSGSNDGF